MPSILLAGDDPRNNERGLDRACPTRRRNRGTSGLLTRSCPASGGHALRECGGLLGRGDRQGDHRTQDNDDEQLSRREPTSLSDLAIGHEVTSRCAPVASRHACGRVVGARGRRRRSARRQAERGRVALHSDGFARRSMVRIDRAHPRRCGLRRRQRPGARRLKLRPADAGANVVLAVPIDSTPSSSSTARPRVTTGEWPLPASWWSTS